MAEQRRRERERDPKTPVVNVRPGHYVVTPLQVHMSNDVYQWLFGVGEQPPFAGVHDCWHCTSVHVYVRAKGHGSSTVESRPLEHHADGMVPLLLELGRRVVHTGGDAIAGVHTVPGETATDVEQRVVHALKCLKQEYAVCMEESAVRREDDAKWQAL